MVLTRGQLHNLGLNAKRMEIIEEMKNYAVVNVTDFTRICKIMLDIIDNVRGRPAKTYYAENVLFHFIITNWSVVCSMNTKYQNVNRVFPDFVNMPNRVQGFIYSVYQKIDDLVNEGSLTMNFYRDFAKKCPISSGRPEIPNVIHDIDTYVFLLREFDASSKV